MCINAWCSPILNMDYGVRVSVLGPLWVMKVPWAAWCRFKVQGNFLLLCSSTTFVSYSWQLNEALKSFMLFANPGSLSTKFQCLKCCVWMHQGKVLIIPKNVKIQLIAAHLMNDYGSLVARWAFWGGKKETCHIFLKQWQVYLFCPLPPVQVWWFSHGFCSLKGDLPRQNVSLEIFWLAQCLWK